MSTKPENKPGLVEDPLKGLTYKVIGLAMAVHGDLGPGHREVTYHNAMTQKFVDAQLPAEREPRLPIFDENGNMVNFYEPDHRLSEKLLVEYKAHSHPITNDEIAQCLDYFAAFECEVLLVFNFGMPASNGSGCFPRSKYQNIAANGGLATQRAANGGSGCRQRIRNPLRVNEWARN